MKTLFLFAKYSVLYLYFRVKFTGEQVDSFSTKKFKLFSVWFKRLGLMNTSNG